MTKAVGLVSGLTKAVFSSGDGGGDAPSHRRHAGLYPAYSSLSYAHVCSRMLTYAGLSPDYSSLSYAHVCSRMLTHAGLSPDYSSLPPTCLSLLVVVLLLLFSRS